MIPQKRNIYRVLLVLYLIAVCYLCFGNFSSIPKVSPSFLGIPTDKIVHFLMFLPFPLLVFQSFSRDGWSRRRSLFATGFTFLGGLALAGATEIGQSFTRHRSSDPLDFLADSTAIAVCSLIVLLIVLRNKNLK